MATGGSEKSGMATGGVKSIKKYKYTEKTASSVWKQVKI